MKRILKFQNFFLKALTGFSFFVTLKAVNHLCWFFAYQPEEPEALNKYKKLR